MKYCRGRAKLFGVACAIFLLCAATARSAPTHAGKLLQLPGGPVKRLTSPEGSHVLYGVNGNRNNGNDPQLWIQDTITWQPHHVLDITSTIAAAWSPDGKAFFVQDNQSSDSALAYIFDTASLKQMDIRSLVLATDPAAAPFAHVHSYFHAGHWQDAQHLLVDLTGHTDSPPVRCFDFRYRVSTAGAIQKLTQRVAPVNSSFCGK